MWLYFVLLALTVAFVRFVINRPEGEEEENKEKEDLKSAREARLSHFLSQQAKQQLQDLSTKSPIDPPKVTLVDGSSQKLAVGTVQKLSAESSERVDIEPPDNPATIVKDSRLEAIPQKETEDDIVTETDTELSDQKEKLSSMKRNLPAAGQLEKEKPNNTPNVASPTNKKHKKPYPPPQILCEALSYCLKRVVSVREGDASSSSSDTWAGHGWRIRKAHFGGAPITLFLQAHKPDNINNTEDEWTALERALVSIITAAPAQDEMGKKNPLVADSWLTLVNWHRRWIELQRDGLTPISSRDTEAWNHCLQVVRKAWMRHNLNLWLENLSVDVSAERPEETEIQESGLFDDYEPEPLTAASSSLEAFSAMLEQADSPSPSFFSDLLGIGSNESAVLLHEALLRHVLGRVEDMDKNISSSNDRLQALANLVTRAKPVAQALEARVTKEQQDWEAASISGQDVESTCWLAPIIRGAAKCIPPAGADITTGSVPVSYPFLDSMGELKNFPVSVFSRNRADQLALSRVLETSRTEMQQARRVAEVCLAKVLKAKSGKEAVLNWLSRIVTTNEPLVRMLRNDLLSADGFVGLSASRGFLLGLSATLVCTHVVHLKAKFEKDGANAIDVRYLAKGVGGRLEDFIKHDVSLFEKMDYRSCTDKPKMGFTGSTELFFLIAGVLRVALYPALRIEDAFLQQTRQLLAAVQNLADKPMGTAGLAPHLQLPAKRAVAAYIGWDAFLGEKDFLSAITDFALLQLSWIAKLVTFPNEPGLSWIPDWMCKEPARCLIHVARTHPSTLKSHQADQAVQLATSLLKVGQAKDAAMVSGFSPLVTTELIRIASTFVQAGIRKAKRRGKVAEDTMDAYLTFDPSNLGLAVFTNQSVRDDLCPTLIRAFEALDIVEGLDVDREHQFDKFSVKCEIAELLILLWSHPDGDCRKSVVAQSVELLASFVASVAAAVGHMLDDACLRYADVCKFKRRSTHSFDAQERQFIEAQTDASISGFLASRKFLRLLILFSHEEKIAATIGTNPTSASAMATMVVQFLDQLTSVDGATHDDLDPRQPTHYNPYSETTNRVEKDDTIRLLRARMFSLEIVGLNVAGLCHQLLGLSTRCHIAASKKLGQSGGTSPILQSLAAKDDCEIRRYKCIADRLLKSPTKPFEGNFDKNGNTIHHHDGFVDFSAWRAILGEDSDESDRQLARRGRAKLEQLSRSDVDVIAEIPQIELFLEDLEKCQSVYRQSSSIPALSEVAEVESKIMGSTPTLREEDYGGVLREWSISSETFAVTGRPNRYRHFFDKSTRGRATSAAGKVMISEARRCHKMIPIPHPNSSAFICFAEERMDLARGVVTGPVDTPYAHGIFVLDVFFPATYPQISPLMNFMTTGGGEVRFHPNLYAEGKVCLSLLGTWHASDDSQKWNPKLSSLTQVLLSIQTQLLVEEPYFSEPNADRVRGTRVGIDASRRYNSKLRLATLRHAIVEPLKCPPDGFHQVVQRHFSATRQRILVQAKRWVLEAKGTADYSRFVRIYSELVPLLASERFQGDKCLVPLEDDIKALEILDPTFCNSMTLNDRKSETEEQGTSTRDTESFNPWAAPQQQPITSNNRDSDDDSIYE